MVVVSKVGITGSGCNQSIFNVASELVGLIIYLLGRREKSFSIGQVLFWHFRQGRNTLPNRGVLVSVLENAKCVWL